MIFDMPSRAAPRRRKRYDAAVPPENDEGIGREYEHGLVPHAAETRALVERMGLLIAPPRK